MPDIAMCLGKVDTADGLYICPKKDTCYRHTAVPSGRQTYFLEPPVDRSTGSCEHFWDNNPTGGRSR